MAEKSKSISDADQKFITKINKKVKDGNKSISDTDQKKYKRLTGGLPFPVPTGVNKAVDELLNPKVFKKGGKAKMMGGGKVHMKKYAKGGGMRKAMYK